jgi:signal peptidase II
MQAARGASLNSSDATNQPTGPAGRTRPRALALAVFAGVAALGYTLDVVTKVLAVQHLTDRPPVQVVGDLLTLYLARNPGAAFSTGTSYTLALTCVAIAAAVTVLWASRRLRSIGWAIGLGFLLAGVLGNLTDRVFRAPGVLRGHVVDFVQLPHWPIFNVADSAIVSAAVLIGLLAVRGVSIDGSRTQPHAPKHEAGAHTDA